MTVRRLIDWHSHILPAMDDGSKDVAESISMLRMSAAEGVKTIVATPHFYANDESVERFLERRSSSLETLKTHLSEEMPQIFLGAEVKYYQGISRMSGLSDLRVEGSKILLLEMPMNRWTEYTLRELTEISSTNGISLVLAHIERFLKFQKREDMERMYENGIMMQVNASFLTSITSKRKALALFREGKAQFVGSDCHNTQSRPPKISKAFDVISKSLGEDYISQMNEYGYSVLAQK